MNAKRVIGIENRLPWHLPADLQYFKKVTLGKPVIMGRKTFDSIGRPLPHRRNIVVSRDRHFRHDGIEVFHSIEDAMRAVSDAEEAMVIGGASFYAQMLPMANRLYITLLHDNNIDGDAFFPKWDDREWQETWREDHRADEKNTMNYSFIQLARNPEQKKGAV